MKMLASAVHRDLLHLVLVCSASNLYAMHHRGYLLVLPKVRR